MQTVTTFEDGQQALTNVPEGVNVSIRTVFAGNLVVDETTIDVTPEQYDQLANNLMTHTIEVDTIDGNVSTTPKPMQDSNTDDQNQETK